MRSNRRSGEIAKMRFMMSSSKMSMMMFATAVERAEKGEPISGNEIMLIEETVKLLELDWPTPLVPPEGANILDKARWWLEVIYEDSMM